MGAPAPAPTRGPARYSGDSFDVVIPFQPDEVRRIEEAIALDRAHKQVEEAALSTVVVRG